MYRVLCIENYARLANATEQATSVGTLAESDSQEGDEAATIELTLTNHGRHQPSGPNVRNADSVHNPGNSAVDGSRFATWCRYIDPAWTLSSQTPKLRKRQSSLSSELLQQLPAFMILQSSTGPLPLQQLANRARDLRHPQSGKLRCGLPHQLQFMAVERTATKGQGVRHGIGIEGGFSAM